MKIFTVILLALFINPVIANEPSSLYEKSGGYERSGGYGKSGGYNSSSHGYKKSTEGYTPYKMDSSQSNRAYEKGYSQQMNKTRAHNRGKWVAERHRERRIPYVRSEVRQTGGVNDLIDEN